jgi:hypothetical protein
MHVFQQIFIEDLSKYYIYVYLGEGLHDKGRIAVTLTGPFFSFIYGMKNMTSRVTLNCGDFGGYDVIDTDDSPFTD